MFACVGERKGGVRKKGGRAQLESAWRAWRAADEHTTSDGRAAVHVSFISTNDSDVEDKKRCVVILVHCLPSVGLSFLKQSVSFSFRFVNTYLPWLLPSSLSFYGSLFFPQSSFSSAAILPFFYRPSVLSARFRTALDPSLSFRSVPVSC